MAIFQCVFVSGSVARVSWLDPDSGVPVQDGRQPLRGDNCQLHPGGLGRPQVQRGGVGPRQATRRHRSPSRRVFICHSRSRQGESTIWFLKLPPRASLSAFRNLWEEKRAATFLLYLTNYCMSLITWLIRKMSLPTFKEYLYATVCFFMLLVYGSNSNITICNLQVKCYFSLLSKMLTWWFAV